MFKNNNRAKKAGAKNTTVRKRAPNIFKVYLHVLLFPFIRYYVACTYNFFNDLTIFNLTMLLICISNIYRHTVHFLLRRQAKVEVLTGLIHASTSSKSYLFDTN